MTAKETSKKREVKRVPILFIGAVFDFSGKKAYEWYFLPDDYNNNGEPISLDIAEVVVYPGKPFVRSPEPGLICTIERSVLPEHQKTHTIYPSTVSVVGVWECAEQRAEWQAQHRAVNLAFSAISQSKYREDLKSLQPLRAIYRQLRGIQREAFLLNIINFIKGQGN